MLVVDGDGRVLLLRYRGPDEAPQETVWLVPGGRVDDGESLAAAAARELWEEVGLNVDPTRLGDPVAVARGSWTDAGTVMVEAVDTYFLLRIPGHDVDTTRLTGEERVNVLGHRWWSPVELSAATERIYPTELADLLGRLLVGGTPAEPITLPWQGRRERVRACLLAGAVGDALGNPVEFRSLDEIRRLHGPDGLTTMVSNLVTGDTQMTLFTAEGLLAAEPGAEVQGVHRAYLRWLETQDRHAPPAGALAAMVDELIVGSTLADAVDVAQRLLSEFPSSEEAAAALTSAVRLAGRGEPSPENVESLGAGWVAEEALAIAVYCAMVADHAGKA